jgi:hypothetical protein
MVNQLDHLLKLNVSYDCMDIILGDGINDLCDEVAIEIIFKQDLKPIYEISP